MFFKRYIIEHSSPPEKESFPKIAENMIFGNKV